MWIFPWATRLCKSSTLLSSKIPLKADIFPRSSFLEREHIKKMQISPTFPAVDMWVPYKGRYTSEPAQTISQALSQRGIDKLSPQAGGIGSRAPL